MKELHTTKFNYVMNFLVKVSGAFFSFFSYPYAFRMLGAEQMGSISFAASFSAFFSMLAVLGIPVYGIRECARVRDDPKALSKTVAELLFIQCMATAISLLLYGVCLQFLPQFQGHTALYFIRAAVIGASALQVDWIYTALEQFGMITLRTMVVKAIMTGLVFVLVQGEGDALWYAILLGGGTVALNLVHVWKLAGLSIPLRLKMRGSSRRLRPIFIFFVQTVAITIYTSMDTVMLGLMQDEYTVGIYDAGIKIKLILSYLVTGMSAVLLPKISFFVAKGRKEEAGAAISNTLAFTVLLSLPILCFFGVMANETMELVCGMQAAHRGTLLRFLLPTVFLIGCSSLVANQILTPTHREGVAMRAYLVGAAVNLGLNALLIPRWSMVGAGAATLLAEASVLGTELWYLGTEWKRLWAAVHGGTALLAALLPVPLLLFLQHRVAWLPAQLLLSGSVYGLLWLGVLCWRKEPLVMRLLKKQGKE